MSQPREMVLCEIFTLGKNRSVLITGIGLSEKGNRVVHFIYADQPECRCVDGIRCPAAHAHASTRLDSFEALMKQADENRLGGTK